MVKTFMYTNSKGETKPHVIAVTSETPDYLMGIDIKKVIANVIGDDDWSSKKLYYFSQENDDEYHDGGILSLISFYNVNQEEKAPQEKYDFYYLDKEIKRFGYEDDKEFLDNNADKANLINSNPIPNFDKAVKEYNNIKNLFAGREPTQYKTLQECRISKKDPIDGLDPEWMKAFKNFKKSGIVT